MQPLDNKTIIALLTKSVNGQPSEEEARQLYDWIQASDENRELYVKIRDVDTYASMIACIESQEHAGRKSGKLVRWGSIAAAVLVLIISSWMIWGHKRSTNLAKPAAASTDVLLISDGETYNLSKKLPDPSSVDQATLDTMLRPQAGASPASGQQFTIVVPNGKTFEMTFHDGSHVMLNAGSELHFPSAFAARERAVALKGEALFQVSKNSERPFLVKTPQGEVKVLGTQFNIKSYPDLPIETISLLEGSIEISNGHSRQLLKPGEQARLAAGRMTTGIEFNPDEVLAWKEGIFLFDNIPLEEVLQHVERWHNVRFEFSDDRTKQIPVYIKVRKDRSINDLLKALETTNKLKFTKTAGAIRVTP